MTAIRLLYIFESGIDLIEKFSLYVDIYIDNALYLYINNGYLHIMRINTGNAESGYPLVR